MAVAFTNAPFGFTTFPERNLKKGSVLAEFVVFPTVAIY